VFFDHLKVRCLLLSFSGSFSLEPRGSNVQSATAESAGNLEKGSFDILKPGVLQIQVSLTDMASELLCFDQYADLTNCSKPTYK
jgi:hypothetical protein